MRQINTQTHQHHTPSMGLVAAMMKRTMRLVVAEEGPNENQRIPGIYHLPYDMCVCGYHRQNKEKKKKWMGPKLPLISELCL